MAQTDEAAPSVSPRGGKGEMIYERIEQMVDATGVTRSQAFDALAQELAMKAGTVAANYYRIARLRGGDDVKRITRSKRSSSITAAVDAAIDSLEQAVDDMKELRASLTGIDEQLAKLRRIEGVVTS